MVAVTLSLVGCERNHSRLDDLPAQPSAGSSTQNGAPPTAKPGMAANADGRISGRVVETMNSGGYTYAKLDNGSRQVWVAGPETTLTVGTEVGAMDGTAMPGFHSDTLNRTFDELYFINEYALPNKPAVAAAAGSNAPATPAEDLSGAVAETMDAAGYTYARVERGNGTSVWLAGPQTKLAVGSKLGAMRGTVMPKFHSDTLNRTFDQIYFVDHYTVAGGAIPNPHAGSAAAVQATANAPTEKITPAPGGATVATVFADKAKLGGKPVVVRGKVTKVNNGILGKNWLHLQDGTGSTGTNDLLVTTQATAKVGDIVTARGTLALDKDFGAGYKYAVLLEDATLETK